MEKIPTLPAPPFDYGYALTILACVGSVLLAGLVYVAWHHNSYRNKQDERRDEQWREAERVRVEARARLESKFDERHDRLERDTESFFRGVEAKIDGLQAQYHDLNNRFHGLKPPKEGG